MSIFKRAAAALSAAALAVTLTVPMTAFAAEEDGSHKVTFHWDGFSNDAPLVVTVPKHDSINSAVGADAFNGSSLPVVYPEPKDGKAIVKWVKNKGGSEIVSFVDTVSEDMDIYPVLGETIEAKNISLTVEEGYLPEVGKTNPENLKEHISVPADAPYRITDAHYYIIGEGQQFKADETYTLKVEIMPKDGKAFDYYYNNDSETLYKVDTAKVNGKDASVIWDREFHNNGVDVLCHYDLGNVETVNVKLNYNGRGGVADKQLTIPKGASINSYLSTYEQEPFEEDYCMTGWYTDEALTEPFVSFAFNSDTTLYAKWVKLIHEVNITIEDPLCGDIVKLSAATEPDPDTAPSTAVSESVYGKGAGTFADNYDNEPVVTCDVPGVDPSSAWIVSEKPLADLEPDDQVKLFEGMLRGENNYDFSIDYLAGSTEDSDIRFAPDLKITVNGTVSDDSRILASGRYASKKGKVSNLTTVYKGGNGFTVVGTITGDHVWTAGVLTKKPGCEDKGEMTYTCRTKDASYSEDVDAYGHKWEAWKVVKPATDTEDGLEERVCDNNGEHKETRVIPKKGGTAPVDETSKNVPSGTALPITAGVVTLIAAAALISRRRKH